MPSNVTHFGKTGSMLRLLAALVSLAVSATTPLSAEPIDDPLQVLGRALSGEFFQLDRTEPVDGFWRVRITNDEVSATEGKLRIKQTICFSEAREGEVCNAKNGEISNRFIDIDPSELSLEQSGLNRELTWPTYSLKLVCAHDGTCLESQSVWGTDLEKSEIFPCSPVSTCSEALLSIWRLLVADRHLRTRSDAPDDWTTGDVVIVAAIGGGQGSWAQPRKASTIPTTCWLQA